MINRPEGIETIALGLVFNLQLFKYLEVDPEHVNKNKRSEFSIDEIAAITKCLIDHVNLALSDEKTLEMKYVLTL